MHISEPLPTPKAVEQAIPHRWIPRRWRIVLSFFLGLLSVFLMFFLGEVWGEHAMFPGMAAYFLISQFFLSRGNPQAVHKDWPLILALNLPLLISTSICLTAEPNWDAKLSALGLTVLAVACSYAAAAMAARTARR